MGKFPSKDELLDWIRENPAAANKREIARAFGIRGADRIELKRLLRELQDDGLVARERKRVRPAGTLPPVTVLEVTGPDAEGDLAARPAAWEGDGPAPRVLIAPKKGDPALGPRDRVLAKLRRLSDGAYGYEARLIKKLDSGARRMLGIYRAGPQGGRLVPIDKRANREWTIPAGQTDGAEDGELVEAEGIGGQRLGLPKGRILERHGRPGDARQVSLIAMVEHQIPYEFPPEVLAEAAKAQPVKGLGKGPGKREDLRDLPLITIDPADARDHDDAVCAVPDDDPKNPGGHVVWVAIADVAHYVRPGSALDREALNRGNSTYFPDRVSPMLPEELVADLCSLVEGADRPCLAVRMVLDAGGNKIGHRFARGLMRSPASLAYRTVQDAADGQRDAECRADGRGDPAALRRLARRRRRPRAPPAAGPRPARAADRAGRRGRGRLDPLPRPAGRAPADRGVHDPRQRRRRRDAGGCAHAPDLPRARGASARAAGLASRDRRAARPRSRQGPGAEDAALQPAAGRGARHRGRRDGQHVGAARADPGLLRDRRTWGISG